MANEMALPLALITAALLCSLVAGFLFAFAVVVMPGIQRLEDRAFLRAFQVMDGVIQDNQPLFMLVWLGSVVALVLAAVLGIWRLDGAERLLLILVTLVYLAGVQLPTVRVNIPLNNRLQTLDTEALDDAALDGERQGFEAPWNRSNRARTVLATLVSATLIAMVWQL